MPTELTDASADELFAETLTRILSTRVHSNHSHFLGYSGLSKDPKWTPVIDKSVEAFVGNSGTLQRLVFCDTLAMSVIEDWFRDAINLVNLGAQIKVLEIDVEHLSSYEDAALHQFSDRSQRLLRASSANSKLTIVEDEALLSEYEARFNRRWKSGPSPLEVMTSKAIDDADNQPLEIYGSAKVADAFDGKVVLRSMKRLDTDESLLRSTDGFVRKYQPRYAEAFSDHVKSRFPEVRRIMFIGDTFKNDGTIVRNLQSLGWEVSGFICDPKLDMSGVRFNEMYYTDRWVDLIGFAEKLPEIPGPETLAIIDLDQTFWSPKGVHEGPLGATRLRAISRVVNTYLSRPSSDVEDRILGIYDEISNARYIGALTLDNEDFKAAICAFVALNLIPGEDSVEYFTRLADMSTDDFVSLVCTKYLPSLVAESESGEANIVAFVQATLAVAQTSAYREVAETRGVLVEQAIEDLQSIVDKTVAGAPVPYPRFRAAELEEGLAAVGSQNEFGQRIVLNKPVWDFAMWLRERGTHLMGISDRPDESTKPKTGESLLEAEMTIYGKPIADYLPSAS